MTTDPARFDVIVTDNLFGDIITDLAAAITGGIGLAAQRQHQPRPDRALDVRARARLGARHRRPAEGRPDRRDPLRRAAARPPRATPTPPPPSRTPSIADLAARTPGTRGAPPRSATPSPPACRVARRNPGRPGIPGAGNAPAVHGCPSTRPVPTPERRYVPPCRSAPPPSTARSTTRGSPRSWPTPASACTSPTTCSPSSGRPTQGWHDARITPYGPLTPRPGDRRPALRAGDLRGHEGLPPRGRLDLDLPAGGERRADGALQPPAGVPGARARGLRAGGRRAGRASTSAGCRTARGRRASTSGRS